MADSKRRITEALLTLIMNALRKATVEDIDLLKEMYLTDVEPHQERATVFATDLTSIMETILCIRNDSLCGTSSWAIRGGMDDGVVEVVGLGVREQYRKQGIASELMKEAIEQAQVTFSEKDYTLRRVFLFMELSNEIARQFYNSQDFKEVATIPLFYPSDDASIFVRELD
ncbi:MAG: GNAT family N-acetyltransferase [Candidatus Thorarchaeota archaeon]|nr:GNAT family N-acetyltransferase [Candidatus Thorarchaeota archaeon]